MKTPIHLLDISLDNFTSAELGQAIDNALNGTSTVTIATPNPEMLLAARRGSHIRKTLEQFSLRVPDGFGLTLVAAILGKGFLRRHPGTDLLGRICKANSAGVKGPVLLLGGWDGSGTRAADKLRAQYPNAAISAISDVRIELVEDQWTQPKHLIDQIRDAAPAVIAVALGGADYARQERWIADHAADFPSAKIMIGVGGAIEMFAGTRRRAPKLMRTLGIEWIWRLLLEPSRARRIFRAVIIFPLVALFDRIRTLLT